MEVERMKALVAAARVSGLVPAREEGGDRKNASRGEALPGWRLKAVRAEKP